MSFVIYPAIDLRKGKVVRLKEGDPARMTTYSDDPEETAGRWLSAGAGWLHVVNLDGAFGEPGNKNRSALISILQIAKESGACVQFGGGIRSIEEMEHTLRSGVSRVILGTAAVEQPGMVAEAVKEFGADKIAVGIDARDGIVRTHGWKESGALHAKDLALAMQTLGLRTAIFTDVGRDGLGRGLNIKATKELAEMSGLDVIASGGVYNLADVLAARDAGLAGVILGRALYEGTIDLRKALESMSPDVA